MRKLLFLLLGTAAILYASAQTTTSSLAGVVRNSVGEVLFGATIIAVHTPSATQYGVATDNDGRYRIEGMRTGGPYTIEISYIGYRTERYEGLKFELGRTVELETSLQESTNIEEVVIAVNRFNSAKTGAASNFNRSDIERLPSVGRSIYDIARLSPQAITTTDGALSIAGTNTRYNSFQIDGIVSNDIYGLTSSGTNGGLAAANPIPLDAIEEIQVVVAPYDVRQSGFTGGGINAITKSGTNTFGGSAYAYYNDNHFYGRNANKELLPTQSTQIYGVSLGGAIVKDKLFYFVNAEFDYDSSPSSYYAGYSPQSIDPTTAQRVAEHYKHLTGYDGGGYGRRNVGKQAGSVIARLDWNINKQNNMSLRYNYLNATKDEYSNDIASFSFNGSGYILANETHSLVAELNSRISDRIFNEFRAGYTRVSDEGLSDKRLPYVQISKIAEGTSDERNNNIGIAIGTNPYNAMNHLVQNSVSLSDNISIYVGRHTITAGTHNEFFAAKNIYVSNAFGWYSYNTVDDFIADNPNRYQRTYTYSADPAIRMYTAQFGIYLQDEWKAANNLTLTYGLRADIPVVFNAPNANADFNNSEIAQKYHLRTNSKPNTNVLLSPRIGFRWQAYEKDETKTLVRGGIGLFTGKVPFVWLTNCFSNTGTTQYGYTLYGNDIPAFGEEPHGATTPNSAINTVSTKFRYPQTMRANLALEQTLRGGWQITLEAIYSKTFNNIYLRNLVAQDSGSKLFAVSEDMANGYNTSILYESSLQNKNSAIYYLENTNRGYSFSVSASIEKHFAFGLDISATYTYSQAKSVQDGISAQASSIWSKTYATESNSPALSYSLFDRPHKLSATISYSKRYGGLFGTTVALVYQAYSGTRYSMTYYANKVDVNGDTARGNMTMYIPTKEELGAMLFETEEQRNMFEQLIESDKYLRSHRGRYSERNAFLTPFEHHLDLHFAQDFYFGRTSGRKVQISLDVMNFGSLICREWGRSYYLSNWKLSPIEIYQIDKNEAGDATPKCRYRGAEITENDLLSRWHMQLGVRVVF